MASSEAAPVALYPYQRRYLADAGRFKVGMWSRQSGKTFTTTLEAVLDCLEAEAAGQVRRWTILSVSQARAADAMETGVKAHLRAFRASFEALDLPWGHDERALEVQLPGGSRIRAIAANANTARGMTENLILDEFAHHQDNRAIWQALLPVISRGDLKLRVISTPAGKSDKFYELMTAPDLAHFHRYTVTIHDAVADGLDRDIDELRAAMADPEGFAQEFECAFIDAASAWLGHDLISACESDSAGEPSAATGGACYVGVDFAARGDLTVIAVTEAVGDVLWVREMVELQRVSFAAQLAEIDRVMAAYRVARVALDQTGLGEMPAEETRRRHGAYRVEGVLFSAPRKLALATALKQRMEDRALRIPAQPALRADLHSVTRTVGPTGAPRLGAPRTGGSHADRFWALALACGAAADGDYQPYAYQPVRPAADDERDIRITGGFATQRGVW
jgi:phage FluMu gp28-like protein